MKRACATLCCVSLLSGLAAREAAAGPEQTVSGGQVLPPGFPPGQPGPFGGPGAGPRPQMPPRDQAAPRTGTSRLKGRIVAADTGQPLRRVTVRLSSPEVRESRSTTTGPDGLYEFKDLPAGRYTLNASKGSYVSLSYGQTRPFQPGRPITLGENQTIEKLDIQLPRGAVITGRVVDEFGEPVADAAVTALRPQFFRGSRRLMPLGRPATTDDIGAFRLFGLSPGQYYVTVSQRGPMVGMLDQSDDRSGYAPTYFPGTSDLGSAQRITLDVGQTVNDVQIPLVPAPTARITGIVSDGEGKRASVGMVMALPRGVFAPMMMGPTGGQIRPDGTFSVNGVPPGEYTLRAMMPGAGGGPARVAIATVSVNGQDIGGVQLVPQQPVAVSGRVLVDGAPPSERPGVRPELIQIMFAPAVMEDFMGAGLPTGPARPKEDFTFETTAMPGRVVVRAIVSNAQLSLKSVRLRGADVTDSGIEIRSGDEVSDLEVELTAQQSELSGLVSNAKGERVADYTVVAFPQDRDRWENNSRYLAAARPDQEGRFRIRTLPPGAYHLIALEYVDPGQDGDPEFLESVRPSATNVTIGQGETKTLDLKLSDQR